MSLLWIEGFEGFGTSTGNTPSPAGVVGRKYPAIAQESNFDIEDGRISGYSLELDVASGYIGSPALTTDDTFIIGLAVKFKQFTDTSPFIRLYDEATQGIGLFVTANGELTIKRTSTVLETTVGLGLSIDTWYYIEMKIVCSDTGHYTVRVGEAVVLDDDGDTKAGVHNYHDRFRLNNISSSAYSPTFDDLYVCDSTGTINNDFLGNMKVVSILPDGVGTNADFTPSAGANFTCVDEEIINDDTDYVESGTSGHKDTHSYADLSSVIGIKGLQINTTCRETDASAFSIITVVRSDGTDYGDTPQVIGTTNYVTKTDIHETDPATTDPWLYTAINAAEFGYEVD